MQTVFTKVVCGVGLAFVLGLGSTAASQRAVAATSPAESSAAVAITHVSVGFAGRYKVGDWTPLSVTVTATAPLRARLVVEAPDPDDQPAALPAAEQQLSPGAPQRLTTYFKMGRLAGELQVRLEHDGRVLASRRLRTSPAADAVFRTGLPQSISLLGTLGHPAGFDNPAEAQPTSASALEARESTVAPLSGPAELPDKHQGYEALSALIFAGSARDAAGNLLVSQLSPAQNQALHEWVKLGGHLVLAVGQDVEEFRKTPLAAWIPIPIEGRSQLRQLDGLERMLGRPVPIPFDGQVPAARLGQTGGDVLVPGLDGPLLVQVPHGFGRVTFLAVDLDRAPLADWAGLHEMCLKILARGRDENQHLKSQESTQLAQLGVTDLASQLHFAQDDFPRVARFSVWGIMGLVLIYLLIIGPLDYFLVHRVLKKPQLTWITFPGWVLVAVGLSIGLAERTNGQGLQANQVDIIDIDAASQQVRGQSWVTLYSPETRRYAVKVEPQTRTWNNGEAPGTPPLPSRLSWSGAPEAGIGGMYRPGGLQLARRLYQFGEAATEIENLPISIWSTQSLTAQWDHVPLESKTEGPLIESALQSVGVGRLSGSITHQLPFPLDDCLLAFGNRVYFPMQRVRGVPMPILGPLQTWEVGGQSRGEQRELRGYLTQVTSTRVPKETGSAKETRVQIEQTPYNPLSRDRTELVRMLTFHQAAGGSSYTRLRDDQLQELDLSLQLRMGRAVLFGRLKSNSPAAARVVVDGQALNPAAQATYIRCVLPVEHIALPELNTFPKPDENLNR